MPRYKDEPPAVCVYTVCDESRYLIVRNVPALGCGDELLRLFSTYGDVEECKPMDAEDCEQFTDVYWIKFRLVSNARFAKRKLDEYVFLGNRLNVSYAPQFETLSDTKEKLESRRKEVLARSNSGRPKESLARKSGSLAEASFGASPSQANLPQRVNTGQREYEVKIWHFYSSVEPFGAASVHISDGSFCFFSSRDSGEREFMSHLRHAPMTRVSSHMEYFPSQSMNQTVRSVREKLNKIQSSSVHIQHGSASKKSRLDNRRRI